MEYRNNLEAFAKADLKSWYSTASLSMDMACSVACHYIFSRQEGRSALTFIEVSGTEKLCNRVVIFGVMFPSFTSLSRCFGVNHPPRSPMQKLYNHTVIFDSAHGAQLGYPTPHSAPVSQESESSCTAHAQLCLRQTHPQASGIGQQAMQDYRSAVRNLV